MLEVPKNWARDLVKASAPKDDRDPRDVLSPWSRENRVMVQNARLSIPLRDPVELRRHLAIAEETIRNLRLQLTNRGSDESQLILARGTIRQLNQKINGYKKPAQD